MSKNNHYGDSSSGREHDDRREGSDLATKEGMPSHTQIINPLFASSI